MYMFENRITLEDRSIISEYLDGFEYKTSGLSFTSLFMWRNINQFSWKIFGDYMCIAAMDHLDAGKEIAFLFPPLTKTGYYEPEKLKETILAAKSCFEANGFEFVIMLVPFHMTDVFKQAMPGELIITADRPNFDYVYNTADLIDLKGRDFHGKRNHLNYFLSHYQYEYKALNEDMSEDAMRFIRAFNERKNLEDSHERALLKMEEEAMQDVFLNLSSVGYLTGAIFIEGRLEALSIGGQLGRKTVTVHIEKANIEYRGLYQVINNEFCKHQASNVKLINREEDMGLAGLRKAKLSYNPVKLVEKYIINVKP